MLRVVDLDGSIDFFCTALGLCEVKWIENPAGRFTLVFLAATKDSNRLKADLSRPAPTIELTHNWDGDLLGENRFFGHLAFEDDNSYETCVRLQENGVLISRPPRDGQMAFMRSPDHQSIELLQKGDPLAAQEPWSSMPKVPSRSW